MQQQLDEVKAMLVLGALLIGVSIVLRLLVPLVELIHVYTGLFFLGAFVVVLALLIRFIIYLFDRWV